MGWDPIFKVRHNLDTSSVEALASDIEKKLNCKVVIYLHDYIKELAEEFGIDVAIYNSAETILSSDQLTMFLTDELFIPRSLLRMHGQRARDILANYTDYQYMINELGDVRNGSIRYDVAYGSIGELHRDEIREICAETLSGSPNFPGRWSMFSFLFEKEDCYHNELWQDFIECRKVLYSYLRPIIKEMPVYYHADQGPMELLADADYIKEFDMIMDKHKLDTFNLSNYILNPESAICGNSYGTVFIDDFEDIGAFTK